MSVRIRLAAILAERAGGAAEVEVDGRTAGEALHALTERHPALAALVWTPEGRVNDQLVVFLNRENLRGLQGPDTPVADGDELQVITALEGGAGPRGPRLAVDAIVDDPRRGVLLVERRNPPHGWALPGGFVDYGESVEDAVVREVAEETGLRLREVRQFAVYSDPARDPRGHTVSVVFTGRAGGEPRGADDARTARFFPWDALPPLAFDHARILADYRARREA